MIANQLTAATMEHALMVLINTPVTVAQALPELTVKQVGNFVSISFSNICSCF